MHADVPKREGEFFKTLVHFQTLGLQIFERKQNYIQQLEGQLKSQEEVNKALQTSLAKEIALRQKVQELERRLQQAQEDHQWRYKQRRLK